MEWRGEGGGGLLRKTGRKGFGAAGSHTLRWQPLFRGKGKMERVGRVKVLKDGWKSNGREGPVVSADKECNATDTRIEFNGSLTRESTGVRKAWRVIGRDSRDWRRKLKHRWREEKLKSYKWIDFRRRKERRKEDFRGGEIHFGGNFFATRFYRTGENLLTRDSFRIFPRASAMNRAYEFCLAR